MSRLVKLILPIASMIGRASKLVMSICSTVEDSNSALRMSLILVSSLVLMSVSVVMVSPILVIPAKAGTPLLTLCKK